SPLAEAACHGPEQQAGADDPAEPRQQSDEAAEAEHDPGERRPVDGYGRLVVAGLLMRRAKRVNDQQHGEQAHTRRDETREEARSGETRAVGHVHRDDAHHEIRREREQHERHDQVLRERAPAEAKALSVRRGQRRRVVLTAHRPISSYSISMRSVSVSRNASSSSPVRTLTVQWKRSTASFHSSVASDSAISSSSDSACSSLIPGGAERLRQLDSVMS